MAACFILISLLSLAMVTEARMEPGRYNNWHGVAKDEAVVEAVEQLMHGESLSLSSKKSNCHTNSDNQNGKAFARDFEPSSNPGDAKLKGEVKGFMKDFEPRPNGSVYPAEEANQETKKEFMKDFEPRPNVLVYPAEEADQETKKEFMKDLEPRPNGRVYPDEEADQETL